MKSGTTDGLMISGATLAMWWANVLSPVLQAMVLILTLAFVGLGVVLRWRQFRNRDNSGIEEPGP